MLVSGFCCTPLRENYFFLLAPPQIESDLYFLPRVEKWLPKLSKISLRVCLVGFANHMGRRPPTPAPGKLMHAEEMTKRWEE